MVGHDVGPLLELDCKAVATTLHSSHRRWGVENPRNRSAPRPLTLRLYIDPIVRPGGRVFQRRWASETIMPTATDLMMLNLDK